MTDEGTNIPIKSFWNEEKAINISIQGGGVCTETPKRLKNAK